MLLGSLSHSGRMRGVLAERVDQAHLVEAMDAVMRRLGGTTRIWRTDRLVTVIVPGSADVQASFVPVAKLYGAIVEPRPLRRSNRKGVVEAAVRFVCGRWWRTMAATSAAEAQVSLDRFCATTARRPAAPVRSWRTTHRRVPAPVAERRRAPPGRVTRRPSGWRSRSWDRPR